MSRGKCRKSIGFKVVTSLQNPREIASTVFCGDMTRVGMGVSSKMCSMNDQKEKGRRVG